MTSNTTMVEMIDENPPPTAPAKNIIEMVMRNGNLPLHGTKALVKIEINLSLGESTILHPITPAALQPNPMHIVVTKWWLWKVLINVVS